MALETSLNPGQQLPEEQQEQFQPSWDENTTRTLIKQYKNSPSLYTEQLDAIRQHANYHNVPFYEGEFDMLDAIQQAGAGFVEGFTTMHIAEPADNEYEQIFRNLGHLAGFAPGIISGPAKLLGLRKLTKAAAALNDKSVPMMAAGFLTKKAKAIVGPTIKATQAARVGAGKTATDYLLGNKARHIMEGAFHLGSASAVSAWQGGVDAMMDSFVGGAVAGGVFRTIGNVKIDGSERSQKVVRGVAGSLFMGLPTTLQGATTPEQVYEYVMGAYFGGNEKPWTNAKAGNFLKNMREKFKDNKELDISKDPELDPEFAALPSEVKPLVKKMAIEQFGDPEVNNLIHSILTEEFDPVRFKNEKADIEGFEPVEVDGQVKYEMKRDLAKKIKSVLVSGGAEGSDRLWTSLGEKFGILGINYSFKEHQATAERAPGYTQTLRESELEEANKHVLKANESLKRPIGDVKPYVYNLFRRNWFQVKNADAVYAVGPITRTPDSLSSLPRNHKDYSTDVMSKQHLLNRSVKGGTGWAIQMAVDNAKPVYVYDTPTKTWNTFDYSANRFRTIKEPPKPPRKWAGIGSRFQEEGGEAPLHVKSALGKFLSKHFKAEPVKKTKKEIADLTAKIEKGNVNKDYIKHLDEQIDVLNKDVEQGPSGITRVSPPSISATRGVGVMRGSKWGNPFILPEVYDKNPSNYREQGFIRAKSREDAIQSYENWIKGIAHKGFLTERRNAILEGLESGELIGKTLKYFKPDARDSHAVRLARLVAEQANPTRREFESKEEQDVYEAKVEALKELEQERIDTINAGKNLFLNEVTGEIVEVKEVEPIKDDPDVGSTAIFKRDIDFVEKHMEKAWRDKGILEEEVFSKNEMANKLLELLTTHSTGTKENLSEVVADKLEEQYRLKISEEGRGQLRQRMAETNLSRPVQMFGYSANGKLTELNPDAPITAGGVRLRLNEPDNALQIAYRESGGKDKGWGILDHITIVNRQGQTEDVNLRRYLTTNLFYKHKKDMKAAESEFNQIKAKLMKEANAKDYYYFGGKGDNDRIYWVKYHPKANQKEVNNLSSVLQENRMYSDFIKAEKDFLSKYRFGQSIPELKNMHRKAYLSNLLYDIQMNFGKEVGLREGMKKLLDKNADFISSSKAFNKRSQIWFTNSIGGDAEFINKQIPDLYKPSKSDAQLSLFKDAKDGLYSYGIIEDLPSNIKAKMKKDKLYSSYVKRLSNELGEHVDGGIIVRDDVLNAIIKDSGMEASGQSKSFIVSPDAKNGALLGKYMMHKAGPALSKQMARDGKHMYMHESAVKQRGFRQIGKLNHSKGNITFEGETHYLNPSDVFYNYSVNNGKHMMDPQRVPKQLLAAMLENASVSVPKEVIDDMFNSIVRTRFEGNKEFTDLYEQYIVDKDPVKLNKLKKNFNKLSISTVIDAMKDSNNDKFSEMAYREMLKLQRNSAGEDFASGEMTKEQYDATLKEINDFESHTDRRINAALSFLSKKAAKGEQGNALGIFLHKEIRDWRMQVIKNFVVREATKPRMFNSNVARMRPYDLAMQNDLDGANPLLKASNKQGINHKSDIFMLDNFYKDTPLRTSIRGYEKTTLGELWEAYEGGQFKTYGKNQIEDIFRAAVLRVPMDSMSGTHILKFKGFTGRDGHGILLNSKTMRSLGGADLDGDEAWTFFGDKTHGFKKSWKDAIHSNKEEFYETLPNGRQIVRDNKSSDIPADLKKELGLGDNIKTFRDLLTISGDMTREQRDHVNSRGAMYSPNERIRISEAAITGRMALGAAAVTPSQIMATTHATMLRAKDQQDTIEFSKDIYNEKTKKYETKNYKAIITPKTQEKWRKYAKELARAQVAFSSDPMDELGLRSVDFWFKKLWGANFNVAQIVDMQTGKKAKDVFVKDLDSDILKKGLYGKINNINRAYWGYNWTEGRRFTMSEIKDLASGVYDLMPEQLNSFMSKTAELLQPLDWSDSIFKRLDGSKLKELYKNTHNYSKKYGFMKDLLERSSLTVPYTRYISTVMKPGKELYNPETLIEIARNEKSFADTIGLKYDKKSKTWSNNFNLTDKMLKGWQFSHAKRQAILEDIARQAEDFLSNDLSDMVTLGKITEIADKMGKKELARIPEIHKEVERLKLNSWLMMKARKKTGSFDLSRLDEFDRLMLEDWIKTHPGKMHLLPKGIANALGGGKTAKLDQNQIDAEILKFYESKKLSENEKKMFEYLMLGTYRRGDLAAVHELEARLSKGRKNNSKYGWNAPLVELVKNMKREAAKTSTSRLGYSSRAIREEAVEEMTGDYLNLLDTSWKRPTKAEVKEVVDSVDKTAYELKNSKTDYSETDIAPELETSTGYEGLKEGVQMSNIPKEQRQLVSSLMTHIKFYNNKVGKNLSEITRSLFGKDLNAMSLEDYKSLNRWFEDIRSGSIYQRIFGKKGATKLAKRHWYLFPKAINKELMRDDLQFMTEEGAYLTKDARALIGKVKRPTHYIDMTQQWISRMNDQATEQAERWVRELRERILFVDSFKEGDVLRQIAIRSREKKYADSKTFNSNPITAKVYKDLYNKPYNEIMANNKELLDKSYTLTIEGKRREYTGYEVVETINKEYTSLFGRMHELIRGRVDAETGENLALKEGGFIKSYYDKLKKNPQIDYKKFIRHLTDAWKKGENPSLEFGIDGLRKVARSMLVEMVGKHPELAKTLKKSEVTDTNKIEFDQYWPHMFFDKAKAAKSLRMAVKKIKETPLSEFHQDPEKAVELKKKELSSIMYKHKNLTGEWVMDDIEEWQMVDEVLDDIGAKREIKKHKIKWFDANERAGSMHSRNSHIEGWSLDHSVSEGYIRSLTNSYYRQLSQIFSRDILNHMYNGMVKTHGKEQATAWNKFMKLYVADAMGNPTVIPKEYLNDKSLKLRGTAYGWWADNVVANRLDKMRKSLGLQNKDLPVELRKTDLHSVRHWSNLEAQFQMASLLAHPKSMITNVFGGTAHTVQSAGWTNWRNARNFNWLKQNVNPKFNSMEDVTAFVEKAGAIPEYMLYELGLKKEFRETKNKEFLKAVADKMTKDPNMSELTLKEIAHKYKIKDRVVGLAAKFMTAPERIIRRDAFMSHYIQAWQKFGGALKDPNHPFLIEMAKKGVKATQFLYSAPFRPAFARSALGKVMTRFQLWSWNAVRFRNDVYRQAKIHGFVEGTPEFEKFARTAQIDMFVFALSNVFAYSIFETALPAPWNWFQDTSEWIFGDEKERDRAFFGQWPKQLAPLQMVTPPVFRLLPSSMRALVDDDWSKFSEYYIWTMFPFGRMARDTIGPGNLVENPIRIMEKLSGFPLLNLQKEAKRIKEGNIEVPTPG